MCQICDNADGDARCNDCRCQVCLAPNEGLIARICPIEQAVIMSDGEVLCDGCALAPEPKPPA